MDVLQNGGPPHSELITRFPTHRGTWFLQLLGAPSTPYCCRIYVCRQQSPLHKCSRQRQMVRCCALLGRKPHDAFFPGGWISWEEVVPWHGGSRRSQLEETRNIDNVDSQESLGWSVESKFLYLIVLKMCYLTTQTLYIHTIDGYILFVLFNFFKALCTGTVISQSLSAWTFTMKGRKLGKGLYK